eukprot:TRINITY_DN28903_c0_g1_i1.p1 TRINITY_DN28903_c0_g1~~TRINITY_DN28903_c0_g1_i1.p1  ORF type:complete len:211 (+),score=67.91 TRINITY_DN28903_c0_g1_i1:65-634(+)
MRSVRRAAVSVLRTPAGCQLRRRQDALEGTRPSQHDDDSSEARRLRAKEAASHAASMSQTTLQEEIEPPETGFVLVGHDPTAEIHEDPPEPGEEVGKYNPHYEDHKLVERLRGTPGFKEEVVKDMLPLVKLDPTLLEDMQDFELGSKFQEIAHNPKDAEALIQRDVKLRRVIEKIQRLRREHLEATAKE